MVQSLRSLKWKWSLALAATSLMGIALVGILAARVYSSEYQRFRDEEMGRAFAGAVLDFYQEYQSWDSIEQISAASLFHHRLHDGQRRQKLPFVIADANGVIVKAAGPYQKGEQLPASDIGSGKTVAVDGDRIATVISIASPELDEAESRFLERTDAILFVGALGAVAIAVVLGVFLSRQFLRPLAELTDAIGSIKQGKFDQRVPVRTTDELGELAGAFNQMSEELQRINRLRRQMITDIAHDLRTPLTVISGYLEGMRDGSLKPTPARFDVLFQESQLLNRLIDDLRTLSLADAGELQLVLRRVQPRDILEQAANSFAPMAAAQSVMLQVDAEPNLPAVELDPDRMAQVLKNLISNSLRFTAPNDRIALSAARRGEHLLLTVRDTGSGIPPEHLRNIFARFYRVSPSRFQSHGESGLGLAIAASIVAAHGGRISAESEPGHGALIRIQLPWSHQTPGRP